MSLDVNLSEPDEFNCIELHSCIEEVARVKEIDNFGYHVEYICGKGEHFVANIFRVTINNSNHKNGVSVIVKTLINTIRQEVFHQLHKREVNVYKNVVNNFKAIQSQLSEDDRVELPECIYSSIEKGNEVIILEDLKLKQFKTESKLTKRHNLDFHQASDIMKVLAKFHALSFVYKTQDPEEFRKLKSQFKDLIFEEGFLNKSKLKTYFIESFEMSLKVVTDLEAKKNLEKVSKKLLELFRLYTSPGKTNVLCHGDFWINNMMFKNEDTEPQKICILDFQAMRYANPVTDIIYFMYICTDSAFRSEYFEQLQTIYYDSLKSFLKLFEIDVNLHYTEKQYKNDIEDFLPFGLIIALIQLRVVTAVDEDMFEEASTSSQTDVKDIYELEDFKMLIKDVVRESIENGMLNRLIDKIV